MYLHNGNLYDNANERNSCTQQPGEISQTYYWTKEAWHQRMHTMYESMYISSKVGKTEHDFNF